MQEVVDSNARPGGTSCECMDAPDPPKHIENDSSDVKNKERQARETPPPHRSCSNQSPRPCQRHVEAFPCRCKGKQPSVKRHLDPIRWLSARTFRGQYNFRLVVCLTYHTQAPTRYDQHTYLEVDVGSYIVEHRPITPRSMHNLFWLMWIERIKNISLD